MNVLLARLQKRWLNTAQGVPDGRLLQRFLHRRDEAAFELLIHRHGPLILGLCRRLLRDRHEAEDALQATFLTLARRAKDIRQHASLSSWLYKVAYRICLRARCRAPTSHADTAATKAAVVNPDHAAERREDYEVLVREISGLPDRLRSVVVLCYLEGKTSRQAAETLGCPISTVASRLLRARARLKRRLGRRGFCLSISLVGILDDSTRASISISAAANLSAVATRLVGGAATASLATPSVLFLMKGMAMYSSWKPLLIGSLLALTIGTAGYPWLASNSIQAESAPVALETNLQASPPKSQDHRAEPKRKNLPGQISPDEIQRQLEAQRLQDLLKNIPQITPSMNAGPLANGSGLDAKEAARHDIDGDGQDDLVVTVSGSRGMLSTYFAHYSLVSINGTRLLRGGTPLEQGESLSVADVLQNCESVVLCHVGGSLMFPNRPFQDFSSGPWWGKRGALGVAKLKDGILQLGFVVMSVSDQGAVTIHRTHLEPIHADSVEVSMNPADPQADVADVKSTEHRAGNDPDKRYFLIAPSKTSGPPGLLVVLPGGDGSAEFHPFVKRIFKNVAADKYLVAQPIAKKWAANQPIVWPTDKNRVPAMKFTTEDFVSAIIDDVAARHQIDSRRIFVLGWSSGGPASYSVSLGTPKVTGAFVAMSVFNPRFQPPLEKAKGRAYYIYHSEEDRTCPFRMAQQAAAELSKHGAKVELKKYAGGHGWHGPLYDDIHAGLAWLEQNAAEKK